MTTIQTLVNDIQTFALAHQNNKTFYYLLPSDYNTNLKIYPAIFCNWNGDDINENTIVNKFTILFLELSKKDQSDLIYAQSNRNEVAKDLVNYLFHTKNYNLININITPITEAFEDYLTGVQLELEIEDNYQYQCEVPLK